MTLKIETININDLIFADYNPRKNNKKQQGQLAKSLKKFGCVEPIIVNRNIDRYNIIVGGHFRVQELKKQNIKEVECSIVDLCLEDERELNLRLNSNTGDWDFNLLFNNFTYSNLEEVGFDFNKMEAEATKLLEKYNEIKESEEVLEEEVVFTKDNKRNIKAGNIFILRNGILEHRLICGDSTKDKDIKKLMNGKKADLVFIDPPYNINMKVKGTKEEKKNIKILNDNLSKEDFKEFLNKSFSIIKNHSNKEIHNYICCNMKCYSTFEEETKNFWNEKYSDIFFWKKDLPGLGYGYRENYEIILFLSNSESVRFYDKNETNVWEYPKSSSIKFRNEEKDNLTKSTRLLHPTIKPTSLIARAIKNSSLNENDIILDTFGGSGSTLIASERMGRSCYICEIDTYYCNVIIDRWEKLTGQKAKMIEN